MILILRVHVDVVEMPLQPNNELWIDRRVCVYSAST